MTDLEQLEALLGARRSVRRFRDEAPPRALVERLLAAAVAAPSASNKQPWRFLVVTRRDTVAALAEAVRVAVARVAAAVPADLADAFRAYGDYFTRFEAAPVVIVPLYRPLAILSHLAGDGLADDDRRRVAALEELSGAASAAMAVENLLIAAHAAGLGASGMTGPLLAEDRLRAILEVPSSWRILALVPLGYPDETPAATARKPVELVSRWIE